ncbi:MAG: hypothetical protein P4M11_02655 [Candidatus Pacebacteria bacterium]|nr:hypothetical protein [Candidatus Paceibacterota bacterium]
MKKYKILEILRIFCVNENKGISSTQDLLYNILFETEIGSKVLLYFTFRYETETHDEIGASRTTS